MRRHPLERGHTLQRKDECNDDDRVLRDPASGGAPGRSVQNLLVWMAVSLVAAAHTVVRYGR